MKNGKISPNMSQLLTNIFKVLTSSSCKATYISLKSQDAHGLANFAAQVNHILKASLCKQHKPCATGGVGLRQSLAFKKLCHLDTMLGFCSEMTITDNDSVHDTAHDNDCLHVRQDSILDTDDNSAKKRFSYFFQHKGWHCTLGT